MTRRSPKTEGSTPTTTPWMRTPEAARHVGLAPATLSKLRCAGGGPKFTRLGRAVVYDVVDLESWVAAQGKRSSTSDETAVG